MKMFSTSAAALGWLARLIAEQVPEGRVVGMDVSDEMIRRARRRQVDIDNAMFVVGEADQIPWDANFFTRAISVESAYYWPDPAARLARDFSCAARRRLALGAHQLLPRKSAQPSMGRMF